MLLQINQSNIYYDKYTLLFFNLRVCIDPKASKPMIDLILFSLRFNSFNSGRF